MDVYSPTSFGPSSCTSLKAPLTNLDFPRSCSAALSILRQIFYQHRGEDPHSPVELPLPEPVVRLSVSAEEANHGPLGEGELLVRLALVVVKCSDVHGCEDRIKAMRPSAAGGGASIQ